MGSMIIIKSSLILRFFSSVISRIYRCVCVRMCLGWFHRRSKQPVVIPLNALMRLHTVKTKFKICTRCEEQNTTGSCLQICDICHDKEPSAPNCFDHIFFLQINSNYQTLTLLIHAPSGTCLSIKKCARFIKNTASLPRS